MYRYHITSHLSRWGMKSQTGKPASRAGEPKWAKIGESDFLNSIRYFVNDD